MLMFIVPGHALGPAYRFVDLPAVPLFSAAVVASARSSTSAVAKVLSRRLLTGLGIRAYSIYLWQVGVFWVTFRALGLERPWLTTVVALLALAVVVELSFRVLERPVLRAGTLTQAPRAHPQVTHM